MGIFGNYDSIGDMFDGGGPGMSGDTYDNDNNPNNNWYRYNQCHL